MQAWRGVSYSLINGTPSESDFQSMKHAITVSGPEWHARRKKENSLQACAICLYSVGFGYTTIGNILGRNKALAKKWVVKAGIQIRPERKSSLLTTGLRVAR